MTARPLPDIRDDFLRLAGELGPHAELDPAENIAQAIIHANDAAMYVQAEITANQASDGPVQ